MNRKDWDRISKDYYSEILSPLKDCKDNPLFSDLKVLKGSVAADLGCGLGVLLPRLSRQFKKVIAVDFSEEMLKKAKSKNIRLKNIEYISADLKDLSCCYRSADLAVSSNSIIAADIKTVKKIFKEIFKVLKPKGSFLGIVPSTEAYIRQALLIAEREMSKGKTEQQARAVAKREVEVDHDFLMGTYTFEGDKQKSFCRFEITRFLKKAGFKDIKIGKVTYPWKAFADAGQEPFPKEDLPWDWYFSCKR